jgi:hypothetical protein
MVGSFVTIGRAITGTIRQTGTTRTVRRSSTRPKVRTRPREYRVSPIVRGAPPPLCGHGRAAVLGADAPPRPPHEWRGTDLVPRWGATGFVLPQRTIPHRNGKNPVFDCRRGRRAAPGDVSFRSGSGRTENSELEEPTVGYLWREVMRTISAMDAEECVLVLVGVIVVGLFCLRGFGSRSRY